MSIAQIHFDDLQASPDQQEGEGGCAGAVRGLGHPNIAIFQVYFDELQGAPKISKKTKAEAQGLSEAEQIAMQDRMFAEARARSGL